MSAFERVPGNAISTPAELAERGYVPLSPDTARACEEVITGPGVPCDHTIPLPSLDAVRAFLAATGWTEGEPGRYGALWTRGKVQLGVPREQEPFTHRGLVDRIAAIEGCTLAAVARQITAAHEPAGVSIVRKRAGAPQQAMQYTGANLAEVMGWITETGETPFLSEEDRYLLIGTPSDYTGAAPGEWLIRSPGTRFGFGHDLADADEFAAAYEPADACTAHDDRDEEIARLRGSLDAAEAKLASYDSAISWATSCTACARTLDASIADHDRADAAEAKLAAIADHCRRHAEHMNLHCPDLGRPASALVYADHILAIIGDEEARDGR